MSTKLSFDPTRHPALVALRMVVAALLLIHGVARMALGLVDDFGVFLAAVGFPLAYALAWAVTVIEIVGSLVLGLGWHVRILGLYFAAQLLAGIVLVHASEGWFVVGAGRNGVEYSVLLIAVLLAVVYADSIRDQPS
ncbi:MAG TPA: DoxX family protein [Acidobacteriota bacterium]|nr:DoxX family protein [Acidobacteriota bacterium]